MADDYNIDITLLMRMLKYKRPHKSRTEKRFISEFIDTIPGMEADAFGNRYLTIGDNPTTMWSCHVDTVHRTGGNQDIVFYKDCYVLERDPRYQDGEPLGADDATGMWILMTMIEHGIEGLYVFHRGEEKGGLGSNWIVKNNPKLVDNITHAIAFDRAGDTDIITHQFGYRCCSDEFANHVADLLNGHHISLSPDPTGIFTDTANYTDLIPECTNISVGYYDEHTSSETQDVYYLTILMDSILRADWSKLPVERNPHIPDAEGWNKYYVGKKSKPAAKTLSTSSRWDTLDLTALWDIYHTDGVECLIQMLKNMGSTQDDYYEARDILFYSGHFDGENSGRPW